MIHCYWKQPVSHRPRLLRDSDQTFRNEAWQYTDAKLYIYEIFVGYKPSLTLFSKSFLIIPSEPIGDEEC